MSLPLLLCSTLSSLLGQVPFLLMQRKWAMGHCKMKWSRNVAAFYHCTTQTRPDAQQVTDTGEANHTDQISPTANEVLMCFTAEQLIKQAGGTQAAFVLHWKMGNRRETNKIVGLLRFIEVCRHLFPLLETHHSISIRLRSGLWTTGLWGWKSSSCNLNYSAAKLPWGKILWFNASFNLCDCKILLKGRHVSQGQLLQSLRLCQVQWRRKEKIETIRV